jgi:DNA-binding transcriptional ArsR family regulator
MKKDTKQVAVAAGVAVGLAALTAAGYFIFGPNGKNNRKQIKGWSLKMKGEILEKLEKLKDVTPEVYNAVIDEVSAKYGKLKNISEEEVAAIAVDLKKHWRAISRDLKEKENKGKKKVVQAKKVVKKAVKTVAKKVAKEATKVAEAI